MPWIQSISNHLWWCCATCKGNLQLLREMWISILNHICNTHEWIGGTVYNKCSHQELSPDEERTTAWLLAGSPAHKALQAVVMDKYLLNSFPGLVQFCHTGHLEVFHSMLLKYCSKRQHFPYAGSVGCGRGEFARQCD